MGAARMPGFFDKVEPIVMREPLAETLGAVEKGDTLSYSFADCVKYAGHVCPSVASAYKITQIALKALYPNETPVRGEIEVILHGGRTEGAIGPIGQVIQYITGAATETGFNGLGGRFVRAEKFVYEEGSPLAGNGISAHFRRVDTGREVLATGMPHMIPLGPGEEEGAGYMSPVARGAATPEQREKFLGFWLGKVRRILLEEHGAFAVRDVKSA